MKIKFANDWVLDHLLIYYGVTLVSTTCTKMEYTHASTITGVSSSTMVLTSGSITCKCTACSADLWDDAAIEIAASK